MKKKCRRNPCSPFFKISQALYAPTKDGVLKDYTVPIVAGRTFPMPLLGIDQVLEVKNSGEDGRLDCFGQIRPYAHNKAMLVKSMNRYAWAEAVGKKLPRLKMICVKLISGPDYNFSATLAVPADFKQARMIFGRSRVVLPVYILLHGVRPFCRMDILFDGLHGWCVDNDYNEPYRREVIALNQALEDNIHPRNLVNVDNVKYLTPEEKWAYSVAAENGFLRKECIEKRIKEAVAHSGRVATVKEVVYVDYEYGMVDVKLAIRYKKEDHDFVLTIDAVSLRVIDADTCLNERDSDYDLVSIVPVLYQFIKLG